MKIKNIEFHNYKRFVNDKKISFCNSSGEVNDMTLIVGNNGTGKSSVLQAIVALIAPHTRVGFKLLSGMNWSGFEYRLIQSGQTPLHIQAQIEFSDDELEETINFAKRLKDFGYYNIGIPDKERNVTVKLDYGKQYSFVFGNGHGNEFKFRGHQYAKELTPFEPDKSKLFDKVGNIYWYTEQRTSNSINSPFEKEEQQINSIRSFLASAYNFHLAIEQKKIQMQP
ncbi:MAG: ATP-binding protein, partial [Bacteroidales bacterium]|nr:ATP-binding protein [Bacteroidales bacterium]